MTTPRTRPSRRRLIAAAASSVFALALGANPALAQGDPQANLAINLTKLLVRQGVITQAAADQLLAEAQRETASAKAGGAVVATGGDNLPAPAPGAVRIPYVPQIVRDEIKAEVMQQARAENWAQPDAIPDWTKRIQISGDVRLRMEDDRYPRGNDPQIINFAALNANGPVDVNPATNPTGVPFLNTLQNRDNQLYIRARLNIEAEPTDWITAAVRVASGSSNTPVSTSQLLGGGLTKKNIWLDRAYADFHPVSWIGGSFGRMPNPFFSTDLVYDTDLNFDGAAARSAYEILPDHHVSLFATTGAFLTGYGDVNFPDNATSDQKSNAQSKWMFGSQIGAMWKTNAFTWKTAAAYYSFQNGQGKLSAPCALYTGLNQCSTDLSRPDFMQKGNTLFLLRDILPNPNALPGATALPQYVGLMFPYHLLNLTSTFDLKLNNGKHIELTGDYARNLAYSHGAACRFGEAGLPVTNVIAPVAADTDVCAGETGADAPQFKSGPNAFMLRATYGDINPGRLGEWNIIAGYKHIAPDAVLDAYTDADFHLGGTNAKGYFVEAAAGLGGGSNIQLRWFSADAIYGPPLAIDVLQIDLNTPF